MNFVFTTEHKYKKNIKKASKWHWKQDDNEREVAKQQLNKAAKTKQMSCRETPTKSVQKTPPKALKIQKSDKANIELWKSGN